MKVKQASIKQIEQYLKDIKETAGQMEKEDKEAIRSLQKNW